MIQTAELAAMAAALLWTLSGLAWTSSGKHVGALAVSFIRLVIAAVFMIVYGLVMRGLPFPTDASGETWLLLLASGFVGFFIADILLFKALVMIGPRLTLLIQAFAAPFAALMSLVFLDKPLYGMGWIAMAITLAGVVWVVLERDDTTARPRDMKHFNTGLLLAFLAAIGQAGGLVLSKEGIGDYDAVAATLIRAIGALVGFVVLITLIRRWPAMVTACKHGRAMTIMTFGSFVGPFLGVVFVMVALRGQHSGAVATILATMPVLILPFVIVIYKEKVSPRAAIGAVLSVVGVALLVTGNAPEKPKVDEHSRPPGATAGLSSSAEHQNGMALLD